MEFSTWLAFFAASWAISISPGAGAIAAMSAGLNHGFRRGYFMTIGLIFGILTQILVVGAGLGALIAASSLGFTIVKWLGVAYLVYLGIQQWRAPAKPMVEADPANAEVQVTRRQLVLRGWMINAVNPKGTVFLLAVVPQFLDLHASLPRQYGVIACTLAFTDAVVMAGYTVLAARVLSVLKSSRQIQIMNRTFGSLFIAGRNLARHIQTRCLDNPLLPRRPLTRAAFVFPAPRCLPKSPTARSSGALRSSGPAPGT